MKNHKAIWSFIATALVFQACSSNKASFPPAGDFYEKQQLQTFFQATNQQKVVDDEYYIEIGDVLDIVFPLFEDLTTERLIVRRDGRISLPYLGDVRAAGRTPMELDSTLTSRFARILKTPELSVIVRESAEHLIYVMGEVARPGGFKHDGPISLVQAVAQAGGFAKGARQTNVVLIRRMGLKRVVGVEVDVEEIVNGGAINRDFVLKDYDIVYVPKTRIKSVADFSQQFMQIIDPPLGLVTRAWQFINLNAAFEYYSNTTR